MDTRFRGHPATAGPLTDTKRRQRLTKATLRTGLSLQTSVTEENCKALTEIRFLRR